MRHPDRCRVDAGENFLELGRIGQFFVWHWVPLRAAKASTGGGSGGRDSLHPIIEQGGAAHYQQYREQCVEAMKVRREILPVLPELHPAPGQRETPYV